MKATVFSIIIPVYNAARYLRACLDSVLAQTFTNWECICIDDGSTDESSSILDEYAQKDARFRVFHCINGGVSSARNFGLEHAEGKWIWFVDSDDLLKPKALETVAQQNDADIFCVGVDFLYQEGHLVCHTYKRMATTPVNSKTTFECLGMMNYAAKVDLFGFSWNKIVRRALIERGQLRYEKGVSCLEDALFTLKCFTWAHSFAVLDESLYVYRVLTTGLTHTSDTSMGVLGDLFEQYGNATHYEGLQCVAYQKAIQCWKCAFKIVPTVALARKMLALCKAKLKYVEGSSALKRIVRTSKLPLFVGIALMAFMAKAKFYMRRIRGKKLSCEKFKRLKVDERKF